MRKRRSVEAGISHDGCMAEHALLQLGSVSEWAEASKVEQDMALRCWQGRCYEGPVLPECTGRARADLGKTNFKRYGLCRAVHGVEL
jgi:hypothetical protein